MTMIVVYAYCDRTGFGALTRRLKKNTQQLFTLFALSNLWMVRGKLMQMQV